jgi:hypothetical protein
MPIVVCDPVMEAHRYHTPHLMEWYAANKERHDLSLHWELRRPLHKVQRAAFESARDIKASHILYTEHDQWGYPVDGLDVLLEADKDVVGFMTYQRAFPYLPMCMHKVDPTESFITTKRNLKPFHPVEVMEKTDLITWAFTLVKMELLETIEELGVNWTVWDKVPTDSHFCQACEDLGVDRWINASFAINHGDLPKELVGYHRRMWETIHAANNRFALGSLPPGHEMPDEEDPHGVVPFKTEAESVVEDPEWSARMVSEQAARFAEVTA